MVWVRRPNCLRVYADQNGHQPLVLKNQTAGKDKKKSGCACEVRGQSQEKKTGLKPDYKVLLEVFLHTYKIHVGDILCV